MESKLDFSPIVKYSEVVLEQIQLGNPVIRLDRGEFCSMLPSFIKDKAINAINENHINYTDVRGIKELRLEILKDTDRINNLNYTTDNVLVCAGARQALFNLFYHSLKKNDEVLIVSPYWVGFKNIAELVGAKTIFYQTHFKDNFKINFKEFELLISDKTKFIVYSSPNNPTGLSLDKEDINQLSNLLSKYSHIKIVSDETYKHFSNNEHNILNVIEKIEHRKRIITIGSFSKILLISGWRIGYMIADSEIINKSAKVQGYTTANPSSLAQFTVLSVLKDEICYEDYLNKIKSDLFKIKQNVFELLTSINDIDVIMPDSAFYFFPNISNVLEKSKFIDSFSLCMALLHKANVAVLPSDFFGYKNCIRLSIVSTNETDLYQGIEHFKKFIHSF